MDIIYIVLNMYISCMSLKMVDVHFDEEDFPLKYRHSHDMKLLRIFEAFIAIIIWNKSLLLMSLNYHMAPLVTTIFRIFHDILQFMLVLSIVIISFSISFYLIGKNQA